MSIGTYVELIDAISAWVNHNSPETIDRVPTFLALAEIRTGRALRTLRLQSVLNYTVTQDDENDGYVPLPSDYNGMVSVHIDHCKLELLSTEQWLKSWQAASGSNPFGYTLIGDNMYVASPLGENSTVTFIYYTLQPPLGPVAQANVLSNHYADMLLYGSLAEASLYLQDPKRMPNFASLFDAALSAVHVDDEMMRDEDGGSPLVSSPYQSVSNDYRNIF